MSWPLHLTALRRRPCPDPEPERAAPPPVPADWHARLRIETCDLTDPHLDDLAELTAELGDPMAAATRIAARRPRSRP